MGKGGLHRPPEERKISAMKRITFGACLAAASWIYSTSALAADQTPVGAEALPPPAAPAADTAAKPEAEAPPAPVKPAPTPYSLPWQLRPAAAADVVRSDTSAGFRSVNGQSGTTVVTLLLASYKVTPDLSVMVRGGFVDDSPADKPSASAFLNPVIG